MSKKDEALQMAIVAMDTWKSIDILKARKMCKEALESKSEFVVNFAGTGTKLKRNQEQNNITRSYKETIIERLRTDDEFWNEVFNAYDKRKEWQGLSQDEIEEVLMDFDGWSTIDFARTIEQKLKEKNHDKT